MNARAQSSRPQTSLVFPGRCWLDHADLRNRRLKSKNGRMAAGKISARPRRSICCRTDDAVRMGPRRDPGPIILCVTKGFALAPLARIRQNLCEKSIAGHVV